MKISRKTLYSVKGYVDRIEQVGDYLVGLAEIAEMLDVSRQRAMQIIDNYEDFPQPEAELASGRIWLRKSVEQWMRRHPRRPPGRPKK